MSDSARDLLVRGIACAKAGEAAQARRYLEWMLSQIDASEEQRLEAWYWLSEVSDVPSEQREFLEEILARDPLDARARRKLAILNGQLKASDLVNPEALPAQPGGEEQAGARRFTCPTCGARMIYAPDGVSLVCEHCDSSQRLNLDPFGTTREHDFILSMATVQGHWKPSANRALRCQGCGASFVLPPEQLTLTCPYCLSVHVIESDESGEYILPSGVIPLNVDAQQAAEAIRAWLDAALPEGASARVLGGTGLYLPVWAFRVGGMLTWRGFSATNDRKTPLRMVSGNVDTGQEEILVAASSRLPRLALEELNAYDMQGVLPYNERYLANLAAETYQVPVAKAALEARAVFFKEHARQARESLRDVQELSLSSANLKIESFRLLLFPAWISRYRYEEREYILLINGQTGNVRGERPSRGLGRLLDDLLGNE